MTCSLQTYRQRIGTYHQRPKKKTNFMYNKPSSFRPRLIFNLILPIFIYCLGILSLPFAQEYSPPYVPNPDSCSLTPHLVAPVYHSTLAKLSVSWDPGPGSGLGCTAYLSRKIRNKMVHIENGNRGKRGKSITCLYWNKGPSLLINKHQDLETIIADHHPHILGLGEANYSQAQDIEAVQFPGYNLYLDSGLGHQGMARVAVYTHSTLRVNRRSDLGDPDTAAIGMELCHCVQPLPLL